MYTVSLWNCYYNHIKSHSEKFVQYKSIFLTNAVSLIDNGNSKSNSSMVRSKDGRKYYEVYGKHIIYDKLETIVQKKEVARDKLCVE